MQEEKITKTLKLLLQNLILDKEGNKFGKSASGENIWLDPKKTSPYKFYQFWLNVTDEEALRFLKVFTLLSREEIEKLQEYQKDKPESRIMQRRLAQDVTRMVHGSEAELKASKASQFLFGSISTSLLEDMLDQEILDIFENNVPITTIPQWDYVRSILVTAGISQSKTEAKKLIEGGGVYLNQKQVTDVDRHIGSSDLIQGKFLLLQKGKKNYNLIIVEKSHMSL